eukprot:3963919-Lingulodinium_polyedra.AAC.1
MRGAQRAARPGNQPRPPFRLAQFGASACRQGRRSTSSFSKGAMDVNRAAFRQGRFRVIPHARSRVRV